jgi:hypothetical protein
MCCIHRRERWMKEQLDALETKLKVRESFVCVACTCAYAWYTYTHKHTHKHTHTHTHTHTRIHEYIYKEQWDALEMKLKVRV